MTPGERPACWITSCTLRFQISLVGEQSGAKCDAGRASCAWTTPLAVTALWASQAFTTKTPKTTKTLGEGLSQYAFVGFVIFVVKSM
jgi:L-cysteine desulfidase